MVRPCVARRFRRIGGGDLASMYSASDWSVLCSEHHGYQRACVLISGQASIGPFGSPVFARARKTDPPFCLVLSQSVLVSSKARPLASTAQAMRKVWVWSVNLDQPDAQASAIYLGLTRGGIRDEH